MEAQHFSSNITDIPWLNESSHHDAHYLECSYWERSTQLLFLIGNACALGACLLPRRLPMQMLVMRSMLVAGSAFQLAWAAVVACYADVLMWNTAFGVANLTQIIFILYKTIVNRPLSPYRGIYETHFAPFRFSGHLFNRLIRLADPIQVQQGQIIVDENADQPVQSMLLLITGNFMVTFKDHVLYHVHAQEFLNSLEFRSLLINVHKSAHYRVTLQATEDSQLLSWKASILIPFLQQEPFASALLELLIGQDIKRKVHRVQKLYREVLVHDPSLQVDDDDRRECLEVEIPVSVATEKNTIDEPTEFDDKSPLLGGPDQQTGHRRSFGSTAELSQLDCSSPIDPISSNSGKEAKEASYWRMYVRETRLPDELPRRRYNRSPCRRQAPFQPDAAVCLSQSSSSQSTRVDYSKDLSGEDASYAEDSQGPLNQMFLTPSMLSSFDSCNYGSGLSGSSTSLGADLTLVEMAPSTRDEKTSNVPVLLKNSNNDNPLILINRAVDGGVFENQTPAQVVTSNYGHWRDGNQTLTRLYRSCSLQWQRTFQETEPSKINTVAIGAGPQRSVIENKPCCQAGCSDATFSHTVSQPVSQSSEDRFLLRRASSLKRPRGHALQSSETTV